MTSSPGLNPIEHLRDVVELQQLRDATVSIGVNMDPDLYGTLIKILKEITNKRYNPLPARYT